MHKQRIAVLLVALVGALSAFLPWLQVGYLSVSGVDHPDGVGLATLVLFGCALAFSLVGDRTRPTGGFSLVLGLLAGLTAAGFVAYLIEVQGVDISLLGAGLYLSLLAGLALPALWATLRG